ncbi:MAG TPA: citrate synthase family protein [Oscillatoriaceae cyanobacterium]
MSDPAYMSAREAAEELGVSQSTLYAYVSRGLIRSEAGSTNSRARRYHRADIEALVRKKAQRQEPGLVAEAALDWGAPVLESAITAIARGELYYRGHDAVALARTASVEEVAGLIWTGELVPVPATPCPGLASPRWRAIHARMDGVSAFEAFAVLVPLAAADDPAAYDTRPVAVASTGARLLRLLLAIATDGAPSPDGFAVTLARHWAPKAPAAEALLSACLILAADHELNVSAFTARCVASAGATPYAVIAGGLAALSGARHGGHADRVEALLREVGEPPQARVVLADRLRRGEEIAGFGHTLYPLGDPRGRALLALLREHMPDSPGLALAESAVEAVEALTGEPPTIDFGLAAIARALGLPSRSAIALFAMGRAIGWIGQAIEQYANGRLIRPRARYVGPAIPESTASDGT